MKVFAGIVGGFIAAILVGLVSTPEKSTMFFFICWIGSVFWVRKAESPGKAWRKLMLSCAGLSFMLPLAAIVYAGSYVSNMDGASGAEVAGAAIGGGLASGLMGFIGFFLGVVFLIIGLMVGRDKQIIYVQQGAAPPVE